MSRPEFDRRGFFVEVKEADNFGQDTVTELDPSPLSHSDNAIVIETANSYLTILHGPRDEQLFYLGD